MVSVRDPYLAPVSMLCHARQLSRFRFHFRINSQLERTLSITIFFYFCDALRNYIQRKVALGQVTLLSFFFNHAYLCFICGCLICTVPVLALYPHLNKGHGLIQAYCSWYLLELNGSNIHFRYLWSGLLLCFCYCYLLLLILLSCSSALFLLLVPTSCSFFLFKVVFFNLTLKCV
jgi:hypothetical protein